MADGQSAAWANAAISANTSTFKWVQLHIGLPGAAFTANVAANTTRVQVTVGTPSGGSAVTTSDGLWSSVPAAETYTHATLWSAATGGTCGGSGSITATAVAIGNNFRLAAGNLSITYTLAS